jgi:hypothetical protein
MAPSGRMRKPAPSVMKVKSSDVISLLLGKNAWAICVA